MVAHLQYAMLAEPETVPADAKHVLDYMRARHAKNTIEMMARNEATERVRQALTVLAVGAPDLADVCASIYIPTAYIPHVPSDEELYAMLLRACDDASLYTPAEAPEPVGTMPEDAVAVVDA